MIRVWRARVGTDRSGGRMASVRVGLRGSWLVMGMGSKGAGVEGLGMNDDKMGVVDEYVTEVV